MSGTLRKHIIKKVLCVMKSRRPYIGHGPCRCHASPSLHTTPPGENHHSPTPNLLASSFYGYRYRNIPSSFIGNDSEWWRGYCRFAKILLIHLLFQEGSGPTIEPSGTPFFFCLFVAATPTANTVVREAAKLPISGA